MKTLKIAIVGCGKIADSHAAQIGRIRECEIVAGCDTEPLMAQQFCERFGVKRSFSDLAQMFAEVAPDVVHVTTPPKSHFAVAKSCLESGCHVYVEKPFALNEEEARTMITMARERGLNITAGHDDQFGHAARRMRALVQSGFLGDGPVHMESYYGYALGHTGYAGALLGDPRHWVRRLPGKLLHNIISHGIARIAEFLTTESPRIIAWGFTSPMLRRMGESEIIDELRVLIREGESATAYFTFSSQMRPLLHQFRLYGSKNGLVLDQDQETLIKLRGDHLKSYLEKFVPPVSFAMQYLGNLKTNLYTFLRNDFHMKSGMKYLIESFYRSIREGTPPPIPYREILLTARIMDAIFEQIARREPGISIDVSTINMTAEDSAGVDRAIVANSRVTS
ncbi:MAG TPA: Gfo/Idh/MocA family oxidoreductase [Terriglobales bacterium]|jgi:predicted dehydrogenase|nr:Gfo/Idh/MocA family oxidoreductase [Terriglobales bacterium]